MNTKKKVTIKWSVFILIVVIALGVLFICLTPKSQANNVQKRNDTLSAEIEERIAGSVNFEGKYIEDGVPLSMSSNPYDYVQNNEDFDKLVALGNDALNELTDLQKNTDKYNSFERYIIAIAIEEITKVDMKNFKDYAWSNATAFSENWPSFCNSVNGEVREIMNDNNLSDDEKIAGICNYGTLAINPLKSLSLTRSNSSKAVIDHAIALITSSTREEVIAASNQAKLAQQWEENLYGLNP